MRVDGEIHESSSHPGDTVSIKDMLWIAGALTGITLAFALATGYLW